jgi:fermentation-respiration switch protein FrsA (DUF1100 family)
MKLPKFSRKEALKLGCLYLLLSPPIIMPIAEHYVFFPTKGRTGIDSTVSQIEKLTGATKAEVSIKAPDGHKLDALFFKVPKGNKVFLVCHGNAGNIADRLVLALLLLKAGGSVFLLEYEGYGLSEGSPSIQALKEDGQAAYDYLRKSYQPEDIIVYGESIGASFAVDIAKHNPIGGLIMQSGFSSLFSVVRSKLPWFWLYPKIGFTEELDNLAYLRGKRVPVLIIHGDSDSSVPLSEARINFKEASEPKQLCIIKGADHNDLVLKNVPQFVSAVRLTLQGENR